MEKVSACAFRGVTDSLWSRLDPWSHLICSCCVLPQNCFKSVNTSFHIKIPGLWKKWEDMQVLVLISAWLLSMDGATPSPFQPGSLSSLAPNTCRPSRSHCHVWPGTLEIWLVPVGRWCLFNGDARVSKTKCVSLVSLPLGSADLTPLRFIFLPGFRRHWSFLTAALGLKH